MPDFSAFDEEPVVDRMALGDATPVDIMQTAKASAPEGYGVLQTIGGDAALGVVDMVDTVASSLPGFSRMTGTKRGDLNEYMLGKIDMPGFTKFYQDNKSGVQVASGIYSVIAAELATRKIAAVGAPIVRGLKTLPFARRIATLDEQYNIAMAGLRASDSIIASKGLIGARQLFEATSVPMATWTGKGLETSMQLMGRNRIASKVRGLGALKGIRGAAASELTLTAIANQNEFLFSEDYGQNATWAGIGILGGGAFGHFGTNYAIKKFANSNELAAIRAGVSDPTGLEQSAFKPVFGMPKETSQYLGNLQGTRTDKITALATMADAAPVSGADKSTFNQLSTGRLQQAFTELEKVTQKRTFGIDGTAFIVGKEAATTMEGRALKSALKHDSGALYGAETISKIPEGFGAESLYKEIDTKIKTKIDDLQTKLDDPELDPELRGQMLGEMKELRFADKLTYSVLADDELLPINHAKSFDNWEAPQIQQKDVGGLGVFEVFDQGVGKKAKSLGLAVDQNLNVLISKGRTIADLDYMDALKLHRAAGKAVDSVARRAMNDPKFMISIPKKPTWMQLDMAEKVLQQTEGQANINWNGLTRERAQVESFAQKVEEIGKISDRELEDMLPQLRVRYNLPRLTAFQMGSLGTQKHPLDVILRGAIKSGGADVVRTMNLQDLKQGWADARRINDLSQFSARDVTDLQGNSFKYMLDEAGNELKPLLVAKRSMKPFNWTRDDLADRIVTNKLQQASLLTGPQSGEMVRELSSMLLQSPDLAAAARLEGLATNQLTSSLPGMGNVAPQSAIGSVINAFTQSEWRWRDNPVGLAVIRLRESVDRFTQGWMKTSFEDAFGDVLNQVEGPRSLQSRTLLDQFHTPGVSSGWDLAKGNTVIRQGDQDLYGFVLQDTAKNRVRFQRQFGRAMQKGENLIGPNGTPVVLDELGLDAQNRFNALSNKRRIEANSILRANGMQEIHHSDWYVPPPNLEGKFVGFTQGPDGKPIPGGSIIANTQAQFDSELARLQADPQSILNRDGNIFRTRKEIEDFGSLWDKAQMEMIDANATWAQGGKSNKGSTALGGTQTGSFKDSLKTLRDQYLNTGNELIETLLADQIKGAKQRAHLAAGETKSRTSFFKDMQYRSEFDYYLQELYGRSPLASTGSPVGAVYNTIEGTFNNIMKEATPSASRVYHAVTDWMTKRMPWNDSVIDKENFNKLSEKLGNHMPFKDAAEMIQNKGVNADPYTLAQITGGGNRFTAAWMLRMGESAHAVMNISGILNAMPAVIRHYSARNGETLEELAQRVGHSATIFETPGGKVISTLDMGKIAKRGFERAWKRTSEADYDYMVKQGFLTQEVAEFQRAFNAVEAPSAVGKFLGGDKTIKNPKGLKDRLKEKGLVGWLSVLSDKSEDFSRSWGHMVGVEVAEQMGITGMKAKHAFAHDIANKMIANYSPHNRPEVFQGAVGAPIGLFQSFMYNYWQRMFRYVETGDAKALAIQYAMQSTLYGVKTVPGFAEANALFMSGAEGETSPYDGLVRKFGQDAGDLLMAGTLSNLPKLFGAEGVDLYSRGDTQARSPVFSGLENLPVASVIGKVKAGLGEVMDLFSERNPGTTTQRMGEIVSNMLPSRPMAGMVETFLADGKDTDKHGQLVSENTSRMESVYRSLGLRSIRQSKDLEAFYNNKTAAEVKASQDAILRINSRAAIRGGNEDMLPQIFETYVENGGDEAHFRRWFIDNYEAANDTRSERQLEDLMNDGNKMSQVQRLLDARVGIDEDEATPDPYDQMNVADPMDDPIQPLSTESDPGYKYGLPEQPDPESQALGL